MLFNKNNNSKVKKDYEGKLICFTGQLLSKIKGELITRELAHAMVMERGLIVKSGVVKNLDYLVVADPSTQSTKAKKARDYGVRIIADTDFWSEIGVTVE